MSINTNNMNKEKTQKKILIATALSFAFFIAYDFLYLQPKQAAVNEYNKQNTTVQQKAQNQAPTTNNTVAPTQNSAPQTNTVVTTDIISTIETKNNIITIDNLGRVSQVTLKEVQYVDENHKQLHLFEQNQLRPLEVRFANTAVNNEAFKVNVVASTDKVDAINSVQKLTLTQNLTNTTLTKVLTFYPNGNYDLEVTATNNEEFFITPGFRPNVLADMYADHGALTINADGTLNVIEDEGMDRNAEFVGVRAVSSFDRYYASVLYNFDKNHQVTAMKNSSDSPEMFIHIKTEALYHGYAGPKEYKVLASLHPQLTDVIEYGWFTFIAKPMFAMMQYIHDYVGNWGWTIVLVTILVKIILFPLSHKGMMSMNRLKELAPKIKSIQEKYKDDKQKASMHMMELYKKEGANPMGGCLPILLQIPVFFAIYRVLLNAIELKGSEWIFWIQDLSVMDPYFILPILMGVTMYVQQKITPTQIQDEMQQKIFQFLPVIFTVFFLWFPAGLTLYWFINNLFTVGQQYYVNRIFAHNKEERHEEHLAKKHKK